MSKTCVVEYVDHVGVAVADVEKALAFFRETFGVPMTEVKELEDQGVRAALISVGQTRLELLQPTGPETPVGRFIERRGEGLHHLAFNVKDVAVGLEAVKSQGLQVIDESAAGGTIRPHRLHPSPVRPRRADRAGAERGSGSLFRRRQMNAKGIMAEPERIIRVLVAKPGLDGHDRGAKVIARALRDAGMEVVYTGIRQTPRMIVETALQEDVDVIGLSILSGAHMALFPEIIAGLRGNGMEDVLLVAGGIIPLEDQPELREMGLRGIFGPGASTGDIVSFIRESVGEKPYG